MSWEDFIKDLLLKGEIQSIEVHNSAYIKVYLHDGAVFKGSRLPYKSFVIINEEFVNNLEERIRRIEESMGIKPGIKYKKHLIRNTAYIVLIKMLFY